MVERSQSWERHVIKICHWRIAWFVLKRASFLRRGVLISPWDGLCRRRPSLLFHAFSFCFRFCFFRVYLLTCLLSRVVIGGAHFFERPAKVAVLVLVALSVLRTGNTAKLTRITEAE